LLTTSNIAVRANVVRQHVALTPKELRALATGRVSRTLTEAEKKEFGGASTN
jgi:hypothetical protein